MMLLALTVAMILTIWFKTNAFVEYMSVFGLARFIPPVKVFSETLEDDGGLFVDFLAQQHKGFFIRLITCPICVSVWLALITASASSMFIHCLPVAFLGLILYMVLVRLMGNA